MGFADRIEQLREARGWSRRELARRAGLNETFIRDLLAHPERSPRHENIVKLARALSVSVRELVGDHYEVIETTEDERTRVTTTISEDVLMMIPEIDVSSANDASGSRTPVLLEGRWPFARHYVEKTLGLRGDDLLMAEVVGDSMSPTLNPGDRVMINQADRGLTRPGIFALLDDGGVIIKRVERIWSPPNSSLRVKLISDNERHSTYDVEAEWLHVVGRVVWFARSI